MASPTDRTQNAGAFLGVLMLDTRFSRPTGDIGNPETFFRHGIPVRFHVVTGTSPEGIVKQADPAPQGAAYTTSRRCWLRDGRAGLEGELRQGSIFPALIDKSIAEKSIL
ncbi:hypothetical protein [Variovorax sp. Varisp36]|uniref:hypothetical protein n=1 Tax=Variovorax sp. Varisp36 TaxID=3243031 RepID=UPI0039A65031